MDRIDLSNMSEEDEEYDALSPPQTRNSLLLRPATRADRLSILEFETRGRPLEGIPPDHERRKDSILVMELGGEIVGQAALAEAVPQAELASDKKTALIGGGIWLDPRLPADLSLYKEIIVAARHLPARRLGLCEVLSWIPLNEYPAWQGVFSPAGYVQQILAGAMTCPLLEAHLRLGAQVIRVIDEATPGVLLSWRNPVP